MLVLLASMADPLLLREIKWEAILCRQDYFQ